MREFYCAKCGAEIRDWAIVFEDKFLAKYFGDHKSNRFCDYECACAALSGARIDVDELPLDKEEDNEND